MVDRLSISRLLAGALALTALPVIALAASPGEDEALRRLTSGGHVLMIRHALAPGTGDPSDFRIGDCSTQRNLDERGRSQARAIGAWLRARGVRSARVYSSQWCRCIETAALMDLGPVVELAALNSFYELPETREPNLDALGRFLGALPEDGPPVVLVTHYVTISAIARIGVSSGEGVVVEVRGENDYAAAHRVRFEGAGG